MGIKAAVLRVCARRRAHNLLRELVHASACSSVRRLHPSRPPPLSRLTHKHTLPQPTPPPTSFQVLCSFLTERRFGCLSRPPVAEHLTPKVMNRVLCTVLPLVRHCPRNSRERRKCMVPPNRQACMLQLTSLRHLARHETLYRSQARRTY